MASGFSRAGRSSLSQLLHRRSQHQEQLPAQTSFFLARFMSTGQSPKLFVGGLSWETNESQLRDAFSSFGEVIQAFIVMDRETGKSKGFGFVSFAVTSHADAAIKTMNGRDLNGKTLRVGFAAERARGSGGFGGSGGTGGSYGGGGGDGGRGGGYGGGGGGGYGGYSDGASTGAYGASSYNGNAYPTGPAGSYSGSASRNLYTESNKGFFNSGDFSNNASVNNPGKDSYSSSYDKREMH